MTLTISDLINALAERLQYAEAHQDLKTYFDQRAEIMCKLFGCDLKGRGRDLDAQACENMTRRWEDEGSEPWEVAVERRYEVDGSSNLNFLNNCLRRLDKDMMPSSGYWLEGMPPRIERELEAKYRDVIRSAERDLKDHYRGMVRDLLEYLFPGIGERTVPFDKLFEMGLPRENPDVYDYF